MFATRISILAVRRMSHAKEGMKFGVILGPKKGSCGIPPWSPALPPPPPIPPAFPGHLIRPPCLPGSKHGEIQTCLQGMKGLYCPPCRIKYKYPPFSENIDFTPPNDRSRCWWKHPPACSGGLHDEEGLKNLTRVWACNHN